MEHIVGNWFQIASVYIYCVTYHTFFLSFLFYSHLFFTLDVQVDIYIEPGNMFKSH